jgi:ankyrin repeat protein
MSNKDRMGRVPLHYHAFEGLAALKRELGEGADPNVSDDDGYTPLHFAAQENCLEAAQALIAAGADVNVKNADGNSPLFTALMNFEMNGEMIELLRGHGADPLMKNNAGQSPVGLARMIDNYPIAQYFADLPEVDLPEAD